MKRVQLGIFWVGGLKLAWGLGIGLGWVGGGQRFFFNLLHSGEGFFFAAFQSSILFRRCFFPSCCRFVMSEDEFSTIFFLDIHVGEFGVWCLDPASTFCVVYLVGTKMGLMYSRWKLGSMSRINPLFHLLINGG